MSRLRMFFLSVSIAGLLAAAPWADAPGAVRSAEISDPVVRELVRLVNRHRGRIGCPPLRWSPRVARVALAHSRDMAARGYFSHDDPDGRSPFDRLSCASIRYRKAGENIAEGPRDAATAFRGWLDSPPHRRNLQDCEFTVHGVGYYRGRWTHMLLRPVPGTRW